MTGITVTLNGTAKSDLILSYETACEALDNASEALIKTGPNGRDFIGKPVELKAAIEAHRARISALANIRAEIMAIWEEVDSQ